MAPPDGAMSRVGGALILAWGVRDRLHGDRLHVGRD